MDILGVESCRFYEFMPEWLGLLLFSVLPIIFVIVIVFFIQTKVDFGTIKPIILLIGLYIVCGFLFPMSLYSYILMGMGLFINSPIIVDAI